MSNIPFIINWILIPFNVGVALWNLSIAKRNQRILETGLRLMQRTIEITITGETEKVSQSTQSEFRND